MPFGKHKGMELEDILDENPSYIVWLKENTDLRGELLEFVDNNYKKAKKKSNPKRKAYRNDWGEGPDMFGAYREFAWDATEDDWNDYDFDGYNYYGIPNMD